MYKCPRCKKEYATKGTITNHANGIVRCEIDYCWCGKMVTNFKFQYGGYILKVDKSRGFPREYLRRICCSKDHEQMVLDRKICSNCGKTNDTDEGFILCKECKSIERGISHSNKVAYEELRQFYNETRQARKRMAQYQGKLHNRK